MDKATLAQNRLDEALIKAGKKYPMKTGYCSAGYHEGTKPFDRNGAALQVCKFFALCPCECHAKIDEMYAMAEEPREWVDHTAYRSPEPKFYMPVLGVDYGIPAAERATPIGTTDDTEHTPGTAPARVFAPTPSGRAAKGELESQVLEACMEFSIDPQVTGGEYCTTQWLSGEIARVHGIKAPSAGAIHAVFMRWKSYGFAVIEAKPVRFDSFTEAGRKDGLAICKARHKRENKA